MNAQHTPGRQCHECEGFCLRVATIEEANTALAAACTRPERLAACEALIAAAQLEAERLGAARGLMEHPIERAARVIGSQTALATALGVNKTAVSQWKEKGRRVPAEHCPLIERMTNGVVRCEDLRPDVAWDVLRMPITGGAS